MPRGEIFFLLLGCAQNGWTKQGLYFGLLLRKHPEECAAYQRIGIAVIVKRSWMATILTVGIL